MVVYTCIALHATAVEWTAEPDVQGVIFFQDDTVTERTVGGFQLALTGRVPNGTGFSDLTSTLTVTAIVSRTATVIRCVSGGGRKELELMVVTSELQFSALVSNIRPWRILLELLLIFLFFFSPLINLFFFFIHLFFSIMQALILKNSHHIHSIHAYKHLKTDSE